ncbi:MAG: Uma2 family endonuclease, partial [Clostridium sp.]
GYFGVPDLVVEIVSPSTGRSDKFYKFNMYEKCGVKEYWIIEPDIKLISVFTLNENGRYGRPEIYSEENIIKVGVLEDLNIDLSQIFNY